MNTVIRQKSIEILTCLPCQHEIKHAVKDIVEELDLNVENQFLDDAFARESVFIAIQVSLNMKLNMILHMNLTVVFSWTSRPVFRARTSRRTPTV